MMIETTKALTDLVTNAGMAEKAFSIEYLAIQEFYDMVAQRRPAQLNFYYLGSNSAWRDSMSREEVSGMGMFVVASLLMNAAMTLIYFLDHYLRLMCRPLTSGAIDQSWFSHQMVATMTGVDMQSVAQYQLITDLTELREVHLGIREATYNTVGVGHASLLVLFKAVPEFASDFELAYFIANPHVNPKIIR